MTFDPPSDPFGKDIECPECDGAGLARDIVDCPSCKGWGKIQTPEGRVACRDCRGAGFYYPRCLRCHGTGFLNLTDEKFNRDLED